METIGQQTLWSFFDDSRKARSVACVEVRNGRGHRIGSYMELATKVAELQFRNRDHVLLFRGQSNDHRNSKNNTTLKPTLFRSIDGKLPGTLTLTKRFQELERAEQSLIKKYEIQKLLGLDRIQRQRIVRWAILQHYEVCKTPLLDVSHSLRIAASFATLGATGEAFVFVLGVPNLSGGITASAEAGLQTVRLSSVCPPSAVRPHIQEGYLLGEYPEMAAFSQKEFYGHYEIDFGRRLIAKFRFDPKVFWKRDTFPKVSKDALYPSAREDPICVLALDVRQAMAPSPE
jgi:FRG domain